MSDTNNQTNTKNLDSFKQFLEDTVAGDIASVDSKLGSKRQNVDNKRKEEDE